MGLSKWPITRDSPVCAAEAAHAAAGVVMDSVAAGVATSEGAGEVALAVGVVELTVHPLPPELSNHA